MSRGTNDWRVDLIAGEEMDTDAPGGRRGGSNVDSDVELEGELVARGPVKLDGKFKGQITCGETLSIGPTGVLIGGMDAVNVVIGGKVEGNLLARKRLEIEPGGSFYGDLVVQPELLVLTEKAQFARERPKPESEPAVKEAEIPTQQG